MLIKKQLNTQTWSTPALTIHKKQNLLLSHKHPHYMISNEQAYNGKIRILTRLGPMPLMIAQPLGQCILKENKKQMVMWAR